MAQIGKRNSLTVVSSTPQGIYLDGGDHGEILLPNRYIPKGTSLDEVLEVFIYRDSEDRVIATTEQPYVEVGSFATLRVVSINRRVGAFLDWGLPKDLLLPFREQVDPVDPGQDVVVYVMVDEKTDRIVATTRLRRHLSQKKAPYAPGKQVSLLIVNRTPLGYNAIVEGTHLGLLYQSNIGAALQPGQKVNGFVTAVYPDGKVDLSLDASGYQRVAPLTDRILEKLKEAGGKLPYDDDSAPEEIRRVFDTSKKAFKQALGALYRQRRLRFSQPGIEWVDVRQSTDSDWRPGDKRG